MNSREINRVAVLGMGTMGAGIAQVCAQADLDVVALETDERRGAEGLDRMRAFLAEGVERGKLTAERRDEVMGRVKATTSVADLGGVDIVIEAVAEDLEVKRTLLAEVAAVVGEGVPLATNTSALSVTEIAAALPQPGRVCGLHFFNPAPLMPLVEVVAAVQTEPSLIEEMTAFGERLGKRPIATKDRPGFLVNRILMPYLNQAIQDYDDGLASAEDLDAALELGLGYPVGPLKLLDMIGLDVHLHATGAAWSQTRDPHFVPPPLLQRLVDAGRLGRKSGSGIGDLP